MRGLPLLLAMGLVACEASPGATPVPPSPGVVPISSACVGSVADYCQRTKTGCPSYDQSTTQRKALCGQGAWSVQARHCVGVYRSVRWHDPLLGGGEEFFDGSGRLVAALLDSDTFAYCDSRSASEAFGTIPACPSQPLVQDLCAQ